MFAVFKTRIDPAWTIAGHLPVGAYMTIFDQATDALREHVGLGGDYAARANCGMYVAEAHIGYASELRAGDAVGVETLILGVDAKKLHLFHRLLREPSGEEAALVELIVLHVDRGNGRVSPFPAPILDRLLALATLHSAEPIPSFVGRTLSLARPKR